MRLFLSIDLVAETYTPFQCFGDFDRPKLSTEHSKKKSQYSTLNTRLCSLSLAFGHCSFENYHSELQRVSLKSVDNNKSKLGSCG